MRERSLSLRTETLYDRYNRLLRENWGFDRDSARVFGNALASGSLSYNSKDFRQVKKARRQALLDRYVQLGGEARKPNWVRSGIAAEAVRQETVAFKLRGYDPQNIGDWYAKYYYGFETKESWKEAELFARQFMKLEESQREEIFPGFKKRRA